MKKKSNMMVETQIELNKSWDEYATKVRNHIANGTMPKVEAAKLGMMIESTCQNAKTAYIAKSMLLLLYDLMDFLEADVDKENVPQQFREMLEESKRKAKESYNSALEELEPKVQAELEAISAFEKGKLAEPAKGIFANVSISDILNTKKVEGLPNN